MGNVATHFSMQTNPIRPHTPSTIGTMTAAEDQGRDVPPAAIPTSRDEREAENVKIPIQSSFQNLLRNEPVSRDR